MIEVIGFGAWGFCPIHGEGDFTWLREVGEGTEEVPECTKCIIIIEIETGAGILCQDFGFKK